ncbi:MAG TPA: hypothetical protein DDZ89_01945 [Clostridiales bacterium]|jgi:hypothetical protein|nr:hypothetical protein [Clostridiales bacterium]
MPSIIPYKHTNPEEERIKRVKQPAQQPIAQPVTQTIAQPTPAQQIDPYQYINELREKPTNAQLRAMKRLNFNR